MMTVTSLGQDRMISLTYTAHFRLNRGTEMRIKLRAMAEKLVISLSILTTFLFLLFGEIKARNMEPSEPQPMLPVLEYVSVSNLCNDDFLQYLKIMGYQVKLVEKRCQILDGDIPPEDFDNIKLRLASIDRFFWEVDYEAAFLEVDLVFKSGEQFMGPTLDGKNRSQTITASIKENKMTRVIKMPGFESRQEASFYDGGMNLTVNAKGTKATLQFRQVFPDMKMSSSNVSRAEIEGDDAFDPESDSEEDSPPPGLNFTQYDTKAIELKRPDLDQYLKAMGFAENWHNSTCFNSLFKPASLRLARFNSSHWLIAYIHCDLYVNLIFESGKEFNGGLLDGREFPQTIIVKENAYITRVIKMPGFQSTQKLEFLSGGAKANFTMSTSTKKGPVSTLQFEKVLWDQSQPE